MDALHLLPEDCWGEILKRVKGARDLKSCSEACLTFQDILWKKKNIFMFELILPLIVEYISGTEQAADVTGQDERQDWKGLLNCRLVCKQWCDSVDKIGDIMMGNVFEAAYMFDSGEQTEEFLKQFGKHNVNHNPFFGRSVNLLHRSPSALALDQNQVDQQYQNGDDDYTRDENLKMRQLLERFGNEIWTVTLIEDMENEHLAFCKNIQTALGYLPNLRNLRLDSVINRHFLDADILDQLDQQGDMAELIPYIASNPFPALPQLEHIEAPDVSGVLMHLILQKYSPQLKSLIVGSPTSFPEQVPRLSNLRELELNGLDASLQLNSFRYLQSPLQILGLHVDHNRSNLDVWPVDDLFRYIEHLPITGLTIAIEVAFLGESGPITPEHKLHHGTIYDIDVIGSSGGISLNFFLYCPKLVYVYVQRGPVREGIPSGHPRGVAEILDVADLIQTADPDFYQSNIWEKLPKLLTFTFDDVTDVSDDNWKTSDYHRKTYEQRKIEKVMNVGDAPGPL